MIDINNLCLLLTGCIHPTSNIKKLAIKSPEERRKQTLTAIDFFIRKTKIKRIVYCDNSSSKKENGLEDLAHQYKKEFEWISFQGNTTKTQEKGKGYGEGEIIEYAINHSQLLAKSKMLMKLTGRFYVKNIDFILFFLSSRYSYLDYHAGYIDTRCYIVQKPDYLNFLLHAHENVNDEQKYYIENVFYNIATSCNGVFHPFPVVCNIIGISGSMGTVYYDGQIKLFLKSIKTFSRAMIWNIKEKRKNQ